MLYDRVRPISYLAIALLSFLAIDCARVCSLHYAHGLGGPWTYGDYIARSARTVRRAAKAASLTATIRR